MSLRDRLNHLRSQRGDLERAQESTPRPVAERVARLRGGSTGDTVPAGSDGADTLPPVAMAEALGGERVVEGLVRVEAWEAGIDCPARSVLDHLPEAAGLDPQRAVFLDTETTGLAGGTGTVAFLVGLAWLNGGGLYTTQLVLTGMAGESALLEELATLTGGAEAVVTYNGKRFDLPLLTTRFRLHGQADPLAGLAHLDLLYPVRRLYRKRWPDCRLATAERHLLGRGREGDLPGSQAPQAWRDFLHSGRPGQVPEVAHHNRQDIRSLAELLPVLAGGHCAPRPTGADPLAVARARLGEGDEPGARHLLAEHRAELGREGQLELARLHRRAEDREAARLLWEELAAQGCPEAVAHLAKHYEHQARDPCRALAWAERLPPGPEHERRRQRLRAKCRPEVEGV